MRRGEQWVETGSVGGALANGYPTGRDDKIAYNGSVNSATNQGQLKLEQKAAAADSRAELSSSWPADGIEMRNTQSGLVCVKVVGSSFSHKAEYDVLTPLYHIQAPCIHRLCIQICCKLPRPLLVWPCVLPRWRPCVTGLVVRKRSRGGLQHPLHCEFGDAVNCPSAPLVWPCVLPQRIPCVTGHRTYGSKNIERRFAAPVAPIFETILWDCPDVSLVWSCVLPRWRSCTVGLVEFGKDREGCSVVSKCC
jgi:hypothetical protein